jgi:hypothetical protein
MPTFAARKLLDLLGADVSASQLTCPNAGNAAASDYRGHNRDCPRAILRGVGRQESAKLICRRCKTRDSAIAAASISTNGQLGLLALWKRPHRARIGALPA